MCIGGCDITKNKYRALIYQLSVVGVRATISVHKVRNLQCEQKHLERCAKDGDSPVC